MERHAKMAARRAIEFAMGAEHNAIGPETLDYLQAEVRRLAGVYNRVPLGTILDDMIDVQDKTFRLLEGGRAKPSQMRDLYLLAAIQSGLLAKTSHDVGDPQSAMRQARTASVCAEQAEHTGMIAWVNGLKSLIAYWSGRPTDALFYAQSGAQIATTLTGSVGTWLAGLEARAAAVLGDARTVTAANLRGDELRNHTTPDLLDDLGGFFRFPLVRQRYYDVESAVLLGNVGGSSSSLVERAEGAVRGYSNPDDEDWAFGDEAGTRTDLALAHLLVGSLDGAAAAVRPVLELPPAQRNAGILVSVARVAKSLGDDSFRGTGVARDLREEITAFSGSGRLPLGLPR
jgi:hypothetical protein